MNKPLPVWVKLACQWFGAVEFELKFHHARRWMFDFAWPQHMLAVEVHGGVFQQGRHVRGTGFRDDREKMNEATILGWRVLEFTTCQVESGYALGALERYAITKGLAPYRPFHPAHQPSGKRALARGKKKERSW
jgi:very-short-patch-repair endonuclease